MVKSIVLCKHCRRALCISRIDSDSTDFYFETDFDAYIRHFATHGLINNPHGFMKEEFLIGLNNL